MRSPAVALPPDLVVRCPYCVGEDEFVVMLPRNERRICPHCYHTVKENDFWFDCVCANCFQTNAFDLRIALS